MTGDYIQRTEEPLDADAGWSKIGPFENQRKTYKQESEQREVRLRSRNNVLASFSWSQSRTKSRLETRSRIQLRIAEYPGELVVRSNRWRNQPAFPDLAQDPRGIGEKG